MLLTQSGFFVSKRMLTGIFPSGRPDLLLVGLRRYMVWTTSRLSHQSPNLHQFALFLPLRHATTGILVCLTSTRHTLMANSMKIFTWSSRHTMRRLIENAMSANSTKLFTVSSKRGRNGTTHFVVRSLISISRKQKPTHITKTARPCYAQPPLGKVTANLLGV